MIIQRSRVAGTLAVITAGALLSSVSAQTRSGRGGTLVQDQWAWTKEAWTGNEANYRRLRRSIEGAVFQDRQTANRTANRQQTSRTRTTQRPATQRTSQLVQSYRRAIGQKVSDPTNIFAWAYSSYRAAQIDPAFEAELAQAYQRLAREASPRTYEYARLRFLIEARSLPRRQLLNVGRRLLSEGSDDFEVKFRLIEILRPGLSASEKQEALSYAADLIHQQPERPSVYTTLGGIYYRSWLVSKSSQDKNSAIAAYNRYLGLATSNDEFRLQAQRLVQQMGSG